MTNQEFSDQFTVLLNSYDLVARFGEQASRTEIVLDEYEKSTLLTQAQDIIVKSYYDRTLNQQGQGFDDTARRQTDFSSLIKVATLSPVANPLSGGSFDARGIVYQLPRRSVATATTSVSDGTTTTTYTSTVTDSPADDNTDVLIILQEKLQKVSRTTPSTIYKEYVIVPISYAEYDRIMSKPFAKPLKRQAWRLFQNQSVGFDVMSELIPRDTLNTATEQWVYKIRYVKRPRPIILEDLPDGLTIDGISTETSCELNPILHMDILTKAVELAVTTRGRRPVSQNNQRQE